jgi:hypothetical protein
MLCSWYNEILLTLRESDSELALNMKRWAALKFLSLGFIPPD